MYLVSCTRPLPPQLWMHWWCNTSRAGEGVARYMRLYYVPWSERFSLSIFLAIASSWTTWARRASTSVRHVLGFELFFLGSYSPLNQWLNTPLKLSPGSFPLIVSNVDSSTPIHLPMSLHLALAAQRALFVSFRSAIFKLSKIQVNYNNINKISKVLELTTGCHLLTTLREG